MAALFELESTNASAATNQAVDNVTIEPAR